MLPSKFVPNALLPDWPTGKFGSTANTPFLHVNASSTPLKSAFHPTIVPPSRVIPVASFQVLLGRVNPSGCIPPALVHRNACAALLRFVYERPTTTEPSPLTA